MFFTKLSSGSEVRFRLSDVICPDSEQVREKITKFLELTGRVVQLSDAGGQMDHYAIVQANGIMSPLIVPVDKIELCEAARDSEEVTTQNKID